MTNLFSCIGLSSTQKSQVFSHFDSVLTKTQHSNLQEEGPISISASARLVRNSFIYLNKLY